MNEFEKEVFAVFFDDVYRDPTYAEMKKSFEKNVAPYLKEPDQREIDYEGYREWLASDVHDQDLRWDDIWAAALKWERKRVARNKS